MRRLFIIRKDLNLKPGKLAAMVGHCAEAFWTNMLKAGKIVDTDSIRFPVSLENDPNYQMRYGSNDLYQLAKKAPQEGKDSFAIPNPEGQGYSITVNVKHDVWDEYVNGIFTKTICECKDLNQLKKAETKAKELNLIEGVDYGFINDCCLTDLTPENSDGTCTIGMWFAPLKDDIAHQISKKFKLYGVFDK